MRGVQLMLGLLFGQYKRFWSSAQKNTSLPKDQWSYLTSAVSLHVSLGQQPQEACV